MTTETRPSSGSGYDHVVHLVNNCGAPASCTVSTDADPNPVWADLPNHRDTPVITGQGESVSTFEPHAFCMVDD